MQIGKRREGRPKRKPAAGAPPFDPEDAEAYESNWYRLLAMGQRAGAEFRSLGTTEPSEAVEETADPDHDSDVGALEPAQQDPTEVAEVAEITLRIAPSRDPRVRGRGEAPGPAAAARAGSAPSRPVPASVRIGVRRVQAPEEIYTGYLTRSPHADYFRADWWPRARTITPVYMWRANHLGAGWDLASLRRFTQEAGKHADRLVSTAPATEPPGDPSRRVWMRRLIRAGWVQEYGLPRVCKTLRALLPDLVPDLDSGMMPWARSEWLGVRDLASEDPLDDWLETWELLEDVLIVRGNVLRDVARSVGDRATGRHPIGPLGVMMAAFWVSYWEEAGPEVPVKPRKRAPTSRAVKAPRRSRTRGE